MTIYVNEEHLGEATEEQALRFVELMQNKGWGVEYGTGPEVEPFHDIERYEREADEVLEQIATEAAGFDEAFGEWILIGRFDEEDKCWRGCIFFDEMSESDDMEAATAEELLENLRSWARDWKTAGQMTDDYDKI